ncbi:MAG: hypothetical protein JXI43_03220 [Tissierellales bacterium]|nr:hypothetical protein [Tissierellales bacterium]
MSKIKQQNICWWLLVFPVTIFCREVEASYITYNNKTLPLFPQKIAELSDILSPLKTEKGLEIITAHTNDNNFMLFPITAENGDSMNYKKRLYGKGRQLFINSSDFPTLAATGFHSESELDATKSITGKSIIEITKIGRPMQYSRAGFLNENEDIISVLKNDNRIAKNLQLSHAEIAKPLFHVWNIVLEGINHNIWLFEEMGIDYIIYNGNRVYLKWQGGRGWQESIFNDESLGQYHLEVWREMNQYEISFLENSYPQLNNEQMAVFIKNLSYIHTGEMVPYYIMRYGFYEGHTDFRADPIAISYIFGLKSILEIENNFKGILYRTLTETS